jgi:hypothetical protein
MSIVAGAALVVAQMTTSTSQPGALVPGAGPPVTIPHGTKIYTKLAGDVNTADLQPNFPIVFEVVAPYPNNDPVFKGAQIVAFVTQVQHGSAKSRAGVGFLFDKIIYADGSKRKIYAYVEGPQVKRIDQPAPVPPSAPNPYPGPTNMANNNPYSASPLWEMNLNSQMMFPAGNPQSGPPSTGGYAHARQNGTDITVPAGAPVLLVLSHDLQAPH